MNRFRFVDRWQEGEEVVDTVLKEQEHEPTAQDWQVAHVRGNTNALERQMDDELSAMLGNQPKWLLSGRLDYLGLIVQRREETEKVLKEKGKIVGRTIFRNWEDDLLLTIARPKAKRDYLKEVYEGGKNNPGQD